MVSRFTFTLGHDPEWDAPCVNKVPHASGGFVRYSDYEALRTELEQVRREREDLREMLRAVNEVKKEAVKRAEAAERLAGARVKALDGDTEQKLREALRFSASRSVISSADERRILSAIAETAGEAGGSANLPGDDVDAAYQAALDNLPAEFRGEIGRGELDHMVRAIVKAHDSQWERRARAMAHHHQSALQASIDASKPAAPEAVNAYAVIQRAALTEGKDE